MSIREKIIDFICKSMLVSIGVIASIGAFVNMFDIKICMPVVILFTLITTLIFMLITKLKHRNIVMLFMGFLVLVIAFALRSTLTVGVYEVANKVIKAYNEYFSSQNSGMFSVDYSKAIFFKTNEQVVTFFACMIIVEYVYILVTATWYKVFASLHIILSMAFLIIGMLLGKFPNSIYVILILFYYLSCILMHRSKRVYPARMLMLAVIILSVFGMNLLFVRPSKYNSEKKFAKYKERIEKISDNFSMDDLSLKGFKNILFNKGNTASGGINGGMLGDVDKIKYSGQNMLELTMNYSDNPLYLKGYVANEYEGDRWTPMTPIHSNTAEEYEMKNGTVNSLFTDVEKIPLKYYGIDSASLIIKYKYEGEKFSYFPYNSELIGRNSYYGLRLEENYDDKQYYFYYDLSMEENIDCFQNDDKSVDEFNLFYDISMDVPIEISEYFTENMSDAPIFNGDEQSLKECINYVQTYLAENADYTLSPGKLKKGNDFVLDFLEQKKEGYCTAFASAAVLMFRQMGVPARYVEGYMISQKNQKGGIVMSDGTVMVNVKDSCAHAWPEIYVQGFGFIPVEVTPGYWDANDADSSKPNKVTEPQETSSKNTETNSETTTKEAATTTADNNEASKDNAAVGEKRADKNTKGGENVLKIFLVILVLSTILIVSLKVYSIVSKRKIRQKVLNYKTQDIRHNIEVLAVILKKCLAKENIYMKKDKTREEICNEINSVVILMEERADSSKNNKDSILSIPSTKMTGEIIDIIYKEAYSDENVQFSKEEYDKVRQYVEEFKNSLQYFKNKV